MSQVNVHQSYPQRWARPVLAANSAGTSVATHAPTTTTPARSDGFFDLGDREVILQFFGTDANNETFDALLELYSRAYDSAPDGTVVYVPTPVLVVTVTLGNIASAGGGILAAANTFFADTIASTTAYAYATGKYSIESPTGDDIGRLVVDTRGFEWGRLTFKVDANAPNAAGANALYRTF